MFKAPFLPALICPTPFILLLNKATYLCLVRNEPRADFSWHSSAGAPAAARLLIPRLLESRIKSNYKKMFFLGSNEMGEHLHPKSIPLPKVGLRDARAPGGAGAGRREQQLHPGKARHPWLRSSKQGCRMRGRGATAQSASVWHNPAGTGTVPLPGPASPCSIRVTDGHGPATHGPGQPTWLGGA